MRPRKPRERQDEKTRTVELGAWENRPGARLILEKGMFRSVGGYRYKSAVSGMEMMLGGCCLWCF